ncbi:MAG: hypothetical protein NVS9B1_10880 [Candidatus Dormibacteraceae bacterium]
MATALFMVKATISPDREAEFNRWYDEEHLPQVLQFNGAVSGRRYRALQDDDGWQYMAVYEFRDELTLQRFLESEHLKKLAADYDTDFGTTSTRRRYTYVQIFP